MPKKNFLLPCLCLAIVLTSSCTKETPDIPPDNEKAITAFSLQVAGDPVFNFADASVEIGTDSILVELPAGADLSNLIPEIIFKGVSILPASGIRQDFTQTVKYTVTAEDSSRHVYTVLVKRRKMVYIGGGRNFYALDEGTGKQIWQYPGAGNFSYSDPALHNGIVYVGSTNRKVYAFNANTGAVIWQYTLGEGTECGPAVAGNTVYIGSNDDRFYALNATTGQEKWRIVTGGNISSNPVLSGGNVIFGSSDGGVYCLDTASASRVWRFQTRDLIVASAPALSNGVIFIGSRDGSLYAINAASGALKWEYNTRGMSLEMSSPAVQNGVVYIGGWYDNTFDNPGSLYAVNENTGQAVRTYLDSLGFSTNPCVDSGAIYIGADDLYFYALDIASGMVRWQRQLLVNSSSAAVSGNTLFVGGGGTGYIYALDKQTGQDKWKFAIPEELSTSTPVIGRRAKPRKLSFTLQ